MAAETLAPERQAVRAVPLWFVLPVLALVGFAGRNTYGAVPPLFPDITDALGLSGFALGLLTAIPTACMGVFAPVSNALAARIGAEWALGLAFVLMSVAEAARIAAGNVIVLFVSSAAVGAAMGSTTALVPAIIGHHLPRVRGLATGVFSMAIAGGTGLGSYLAVPLEHALGGWEQSMASWTVITVVTTIGWIALIPRLRASESAPSAGVDPVVPAAVVSGLPWRSPTARWVTVFVSLQSLIAFSVVVWIVPALQSEGWSSSRAAGVMVLFQAAQAVAMLAIPYYSDRLADAHWLIVCSGLATVIGVLGLAVAPLATAIPAAILIGIGLGGGFSMGFILIVGCTSTKLDAGRLGAMVFLVAYVVGAFGPLAVGALHDLTGGYRAGFLIMSGLGLFQAASAWPLRSGRTIADERR